CSDRCSIPIPTNRRPTPTFGVKGCRSTLHTAPPLTPFGSGAVSVLLVSSLTRFLLNSIAMCVSGEIFILWYSCGERVTDVKVHRCDLVVLSPTFTFDFVTGNPVNI